MRLTDWRRRHRLGASWSTKSALANAGLNGDDRLDRALDMVRDIVILVDHRATRSMRGAKAGDLSAAISSRPTAIFLRVEVEAAKLAEDGAMFCLDKFHRVCVG